MTSSEGDTRGADRFSLLLFCLSLSASTGNRNEIRCAGCGQFGRVAIKGGKMGRCRGIKANDVSERAGPLAEDRLSRLPYPSNCTTARNRIRYSGRVTPSGARGIERPAARIASSSSIPPCGEEEESRNRKRFIPLCTPLRLVLCVLSRDGQRERERERGRSIEWTLSARPHFWNDKYAGRSNCSTHPRSPPPAARYI